MLTVHARGGGFDIVRDAPESHFMGAGVECGVARGRMTIARLADRTKHGEPATLFQKRNRDAGHRLKHGEFAGCGNAVDRRDMYMTNEGGLRMRGAQTVPCGFRVGDIVPFGRA